jgi:DNA-binding phage protein
MPVSISKTGLLHRSFYIALGAEIKSEFTTILKMISALDFKITARFVYPHSTSLAAMGAEIEVRY